LVVKKKAFLEVILAKNFREGARTLIQASGLGAVRPNTAVLGYMEDWRKNDKQYATEYVNAIRDCFAFDMNTMIVRGHKQLSYVTPVHGETIDVWWLAEDGGMTVLVPYILSQHEYWRTSSNGAQSKTARMRILACVKHGTSELQTDKLRVTLQNNMIALRFVDWDIKIVELPEKAPEELISVYNQFVCPVPLSDQTANIARRTNSWLLYASVISKHSRGAKLVVMTLPLPRAHVDTRVYLSWLDLLSRDFHVPCILMRGNGANILTDRSE